MKSFRKPMISGLALCALALTAGADDSSVDVRVDAGNVSVVAIGGGAQAAINLGGMSTPGRAGCAKVRVKHGDIRRIAIGQDARALVQIPEDSSRCEEKKP